MPTDPIDDNGEMSLWMIVLLALLPLFGLIFVYLRNRNRQALRWSSEQSFEFPLEQVPPPSQMTWHTPVGEEILPQETAPSGQVQSFTAPQAPEAPAREEQPAAPAEQPEALPADHPARAEDEITEEPAAALVQAPPDQEGPQALDDLKVIEGIGPKTEEVFYGAGIKTYRQLADTSIDRLQEVLDVAKLRGDPGTWPDQAALAAQGRWEELSRLQSQLMRGRRPE